MKITLTILAALAAVGAMDKEAAEKVLNVIPMPQSVQWGAGNFSVKGAAFNYDPGIDPVVVEDITKLADELYIATGKAGSVASATGVDASTPIGSLKGFFFLKDETLAQEAYRIEITRRAAKVTASGRGGFLYALSTIRQMLPEAIYGGGPAAAKWVLPCCTIDDYPRFAYRGMHLDCARHFYSVDDVKKYLDLIAMYKVNRFHWHLTDDQGWRIEIKKYPKLTETGAFRKGTQKGNDNTRHDGKRYGGYYTQEQIRDIVAYADRLGIVIIPEIDLPGHMLAALASYPELGCTGGPYEVWTRWGVSKDVLCVGQEKTFEFLFDVLDELCALFPGEYIHIGGDECPKNNWKDCPRCQAKTAELGLKDDGQGTKEQRLQNYVTKRVQDYLGAKGRRIIGWDEILEGELAPGATVMSWRGTKGGVKASKKGFDVIMTPNNYCYFDYKQDESDEYGAFYWKQKLDAAVVYSYEPLEGIPAGDAKHILGVQANVWTEHIHSLDEVQYMILPRLLALSEVQWCKPENKDYGRFRSVVAGHEFKIFDILGLHYRKPL